MRFYKSTKAGTNVGVGDEDKRVRSVSISRFAHGEHAAGEHLPFVTVGIFMTVGEAEELSALLAEAVAHAKEQTDGCS